MFLFNRGTRRNRIESDVVRPTLSLHVPAFGGIVMKPISLQEDTFLTGQLEVEMPTVYQDGLDCEGLSVWLEGRWTDLEDDREKGTTVCFQQIAVVDVAQDQSLRLWPGTQRFTFNLALPSSLPRNGTAPSGRLLYWLVGSIEGLSHTAPAPPGNRHTTSRLPSSSRDGDSIENMRGSQSLHAAGADASSLPVYSERSPHGGALHRQTTSRCERRIAVSHNPNPEGGVNRLDDDFTHDLPGFGTCRTQVRVNEWCVRCYFPLRFTCLALSPSAALFALRVRIAATTVATSPSTGKPLITKESFLILEHGRIPVPAAAHPSPESPALWRGVHAGGNDSGDYQADLTGRLPGCDQLRPSTLPGTFLPGVAIPIRNSHKLVYEIFFSVYGELADGSPMPKPGPGGMRLMRRAIDVVLPQCVLVSEILNLPSYSTVFGENIRRSDEYVYHRIEANLPCSTCHVIPLHNICTACPRDTIPHVQHSKPKSKVHTASKKDRKDRAMPVQFDPSIESCPTCSGQSILPTEDPNYHLCGCEIEGREAAYGVIWDEQRPVIEKVVP